MQARVLIVDDNAQNLKLARLLLSSEGYEIRTAAQADDAMTCVADFDPDVILMDLQLPGIGGLELTRRIKSKLADRERAIVVVSAYAMKGDRDTALAAGCDEYVTKPIDIDRLLAIVGAQAARVRS